MQRTQSTLSPQVQNIKEVVKSIKEANKGASRAGKHGFKTTPKTGDLISSINSGSTVVLPAELGLDETGAKHVLQAHSAIKEILKAPAASDTDPAVQGVLDRLRTQLGSQEAYDKVVNA